MIGTKYISDLITDPNALLQGRINIIDAGVSAGKTRFALVKLLNWVGNPERCLYLIDTTNGELRIQDNIVKEAAKEAIGREPYAFYDYNTKKVWGEDESVGRMPVMTYAGFGAEVRKNEGKFHWLNFDYIICDEMQNLVDYQRFNDRSKNLEVAELALRMIAAEKETKIVAMSATPQKIRDRFGELCYDVRFDRTDLRQLETFSCIPYIEKVEDLILKLKGKTGILYTTNIKDMERYIDYANSIGVRANGFWSVSAAGHPLSAAQIELRKKVLTEETIPGDIDLLVINRASETCIKIKEKNRKVDFMIVHDKNEEIKTQVRGRYHGDLSEFYYHDLDAWNRNQVKKHPLPEEFLGRRLYTEDLKDFRWMLNLLRPDGVHLGTPTILKYLSECGYDVSRPIKESGKHGKYYRIITAKRTNSV